MLRKMLEWVPLYCLVKRNFVPGSAGLGWLVSDGFTSLSVMAR